MLGKQTDHLKRFQYWLSMSLVYTNVFTQINICVNLNICVFTRKYRSSIPYFINIFRIFDLVPFPTHVTIAAGVLILT